MPAILMLIPTIWSVLERVLGPVVSNTSGLFGSVISAVISSPTVGSIIKAVETSIGTLEDTKKTELQAQLEIALGQIDLDKIDAQSNRFIQWGWRPCFAWGIGLNIILHYSVVNIVDILNSLFHLGISQIPQMDNMALALMTGILGLYMGARTVEKTANRR